MSKRVLAITTLVVSSIAFGIVLTPLIFRLEETIENALIYVVLYKFQVDWITSNYYANIIEAGCAIILLAPLVLWRRKLRQFGNPEKIQELETWKILSRFFVIGLLFSITVITSALLTLGFVIEINSGVGL